MRSGEDVEHARGVLRALELAAREEIPKEDVAIAFSGGLDSSIISSLAKRHCHPILYTVGVEGSYDLDIGEQTADFLGLPWEGILVDEDDLIDSIFEIVSIIPTTNPVTISFEMPLFLVASRVRQRHLFSGQGADELFAGYARYVEMSDEERALSLNNDLANLLEKGLSYEREIAGSKGKELHYLYLHPRVIEVVRAIPVMKEFRGGERKAVLRDVGRLLDLGEIADRRKKAAQYGSGIMKTLRKMAKRNGMTVRAFIRLLAREGEIP